MRKLFGKKEEGMSFAKHIFSYQFFSWNYVDETLPGNSSKGLRFGISFAPLERLALVIRIEIQDGIRLEFSIRTGY